MKNELLYSATALSTGNGRDGHVRTTDQTIDMELRMPVELGGSGGPYANPEELFAAGYSACFLSALNRAIRTSRSKAEATKVTVTVGLGRDQTGGFKLAAAIETFITGVSPTEAQQLTELAHTICPYSKAVKGNIEVMLTSTTEAVKTT